MAKNKDQNCTVNVTPPQAHEIRELYRGIRHIYAEDDHWHAVTHEWIRRFITSMIPKPVGWCLNLGSGGESYGLPETSLIHVDLHTGPFAPGQRVLVADIQNLPPLDRSFDACLCVGSVLNHCDAASVIHNIAHAMKPGGRLVLDFETSASFELLTNGAFLQSATVIDTFYQHHSIRLWAYAEGYVRSLLAASQFKVIGRDTRHHLSPLVYLLCRNSNFAARFCVLDALARRIPGLRQCASHVIYACRKASQMCPEAGSRGVEPLC
jgi:SAM-dependent methyltransferase